MSASSGPPSSALARVVELLAFLCELAMLVLLAFAGSGLTDSTWIHIALAIALPVLAVAVWAVWMAPTSGRRLADPGRLAGQVVLFVVTGALAATAGHPVWGVAFAVVAIIVFAAARRFDGVTGSAPVRSAREFDSA